jgi:hypothetical protein
VRIGLRAEQQHPQLLHEDLHKVIVSMAMLTTSAVHEERLTKLSQAKKGFYLGFGRQESRQVYLHLPGVQFLVRLEDAENVLDYHFVFHACVNNGKLFSDDPNSSEIPHD